MGCTVGLPVADARRWRPPVTTIARPDCGSGGGVRLASASGSPEESTAQAERLERLMKRELPVRDGYPGAEACALCATG